MKKIFFLLIFLLPGCNFNQKDVNLINSSRGFISKSNNNYFMVRDTMLFRKHSIDCLTFVRSNSFYTKNPKLYMDIYDGINKKIKIIKDSLNSVKN